MAKILFTNVTNQTWFIFKVIKERQYIFEIFKQTRLEIASKEMIHSRNQQKC